MFQSAGRVTAGALDTATQQPMPALPLEAPATDALYFQRCRWCGSATFHRLLCPICASTDLLTEHSEGTGFVLRTHVAHRNTPSARNVSLIELDEGFTVRGRVMGPFIAIRPGCRVRLHDPEDTVRKEPVFELRDALYEGWSW